MKSIYFLLILIIPIGLFAQQGPLSLRFEEAKKLYEQEEYQAYKTEMLALLASPGIQEEAGLYRMVLIETGSVLADLADYDIGFDYYQQALDYREEGKEAPDSLLATIYNDMGYIRGRQSRFNEQLDFYKKALSYRIKLFGENHQETARSYNNIGYCLGRMRKYEEQLDYFQKALAIRLEVFGENHEQTALSFNNLGYCYGRLGDYEKEIFYYKKALKLRREIYGEKHSMVARTLGNIGYNLHNTRKFTEAISYFEQAMNLYIDIFGMEHPHVSGMLENIGSAYGQLGYLDKCLLYLNNGLKINRKHFGEISEEVAQNLNNQAVFSARLGDHEKAIGLFEQSLEISKMIWGEKSQIVANRISKVAISHLRLGNDQKCLKLYNEAFDMLTYLDPNPNYDLADIYYRKGNLYMVMDSMEKAKPLLWEANRQFGIIKDIPRQSSVDQAIGLFYSKQGAYDSALYHFNLAIQHMVPSFTWDELYENPPQDALISENMLMDALIFKGETLQEKGTRQKDEEALEHALATYQLAIPIIEQRRLERGEKTRQRLSSEIRNVFAHIIQTGSELYTLSEDEEYKEQVFEAMENSRAYLLREQLHLEQVNAYAGLPDSLLTQDQSLKQALVFYQNKIKDEQGGRNDSAKIARWRSILVEKQLKRDQLHQQLSQSHPRYFALKHELPQVSMKENQIDLSKRNTCLLTYFRADSTLYALVLSSKGSHLNALKLPANFDSLMDSYLQELRSPDLQTNPTSSFTQFCQNSHALYNLLVAPVRNHIPKDKQLLIIPDGKLGYMPFECLISELPEDLDEIDYQSLTYLFKDFEIGYSYHTQYKRDKSSSSKTRYLAFAPAFGSEVSGDSLRRSLPALHHAQEELEVLADAFSGTPFLGEQATEAAFKQQASQFALLHLATHSWQEPGSETPYLIFSRFGDSQEDGKLHSYELYNQNLTAEMAVLSACNTGVGELQQGEGIMSLAHAFAFAGCPNIQMSLWQVNDQATAKLMDEFYGHIADKQRKSFALREAKTYFLRKADLLRSHPHYWAGMVSIGDQSPLKKGNLKLYVTIGMILFVMLGVRVWRLNNQRRSKRSAA